MSWLQLDPESIVARAREGEAPPSLGESIGRGIVGFTLVSVAGFLPWALFGRWFYPRIGEAGLYAVCALVFIGLSGPLLHRLIIGRGSLPRFYKLFGLAFAAYSVGWMGFWFAVGGDAGGTLGLLAGTAILGAIIASAFKAWKVAPQVIGSLFVLNTAGYHVGGWLEQKLAAVHLLSAMLLWGVFYGIGLGSGLGLAFYLCQAKARTLLSARTMRGAA